MTRPDRNSGIEMLVDIVLLIRTLNVKFTLAFAAKRLNRA
jgi:hypothetical protein